jgi:hypothetical protein
MSQVALTDEMPQIIEDTKDNAELVREINRMYKNRIKKILSDIYQRSITENTNIGITPEESLEIDNLLEKIYGNSERLNEGLIYPSQLSHAQISGNIMSTESVGQQPMFGQQPQSQSPQSKHGDPDKSSKQQPSPGQPTPPGAAAAGVAGAAQPSPAAAQPSLTDKIKNKLKNAATATRKIFSKKSPEEVKAAAQAKAEREAEAQANRAEQIKIEEAAGLKRGKGIVGRASDSVKNTLSSVKNTLSSVKNPFNKTQKKTDPENTSESKPLLGDSSRSNDSNDSATQKKSWRESASARVKTAKNALISTKDALLNRITRKNRGTQNPEGSAIEMQEIKEDDSSQPTSSQTPPTRAPPPRPTSVPPSSPAVSPPPPPRPTSFPPPAPTSVPPAEKFTQAGCNITRKNRQYIHEIKDNRTHLFNKEMEIINSIRNFKHGHIHEPKKQFINVIKRS